MTLFTAGAMLSAVFSLLQLIHAGTTPDFFAPNATAASADQEDEAASFRALCSWSFIFKSFAYMFISNNQIWAGPAESLKANL